MQRTTLGLTFAIMLLSTGTAATAGVPVLIDFDDGTGSLEPIDDYYASLGVVFENGLWNQNLVGEPGKSEPFVLQAVDSGTPFVSVFDEAHAIKARFPVPLDGVSVVALDVGLAGAEMKAYDAEVGGSVLGFDNIGGAGSGVGNFGTLTVTAPGIRRVELYQPFPNPLSSDGVGFEDMQFDLPVPTVPSLSLPGLAALVGALSIVAFQGLPARR